MCVHVFGNKPSPSVATYGLRKTVENCGKQYGHDVKEFINRNFYVDDGLVSLPTAEGVVNLMKRTQSALKAEGQIRLHKISSNSHEVMKAFPQEGLGNELKTLEIGKDFLPV